MRRFVLRASCSYSFNNRLAFSKEDACSVSSRDNRFSLAPSILEFFSEASNLVSEASSFSCKFQVLQRFACALVELAGLIFCGGISAREAAHKAWLDEDFLTELSQRQGVKDYCVAIQQLNENFTP